MKGGGRVIRGGGAGEGAPGECLWGGGRANFFFFGAEMPTKSWKRDFLGLPQSNPKSNPKSDYVDPKKPLLS